MLLPGSSRLSILEVPARAAAIAEEFLQLNPEINLACSQSMDLAAHSFPLYDKALDAEITHYDVGAYLIRKHFEESSVFSTLGDKKNVLLKAIIGDVYYKPDKQSYSARVKQLENLMEGSTKEVILREFPEFVRELKKIIDAHLKIPSAQARDNLRDSILNPISKILMISTSTTQFGSHELRHIIGSYKFAVSNPEASESYYLVV